MYETSPGESHVGKLLDRDSLSHGTGIAASRGFLVLRLAHALRQCTRSRLRVWFADMTIHCPHCGNLAAPAGHENGRAFYQCEKCDRVWMTFLSTSDAADDAHAPMKVLVVDDSNDLLQLIASWLEDVGYIVTTATSGRQALDIVQSHDPDIVLLDLVIPPPDGLAVSESLLQLKRPPE